MAGYQPAPHFFMATLHEALATSWGHYQAGRFAKAEQLCRQILAIAPGHPETLAVLGAACAALGRLDEAAASFRLAACHRPEFFEAWHGLGDALHRQGKLADAEAAYQQALQLQPDAFELHNNPGT